MRLRDSKPRRAAAPSPDAWTILILLALVSALHQFHRAGPNVLGSQIKAEYGFSETDLGQLFTAFYVTYTLAMLAGGWLADRVGTWWTLLVVTGGSGLCGGLIGAAGWAAAGGASAWWTILLVRALMGVASAPLYPSTSRTVGSWFFVEAQPWANATVTAAALVGTAASNPVLVYLSKPYGWRAAFVIAAVITTVPLLVAWAILGRRKPPLDVVQESGSQASSTGDPIRPGAWGRAFRHRGLWGLALSYVAVGYYEYVIMLWLPYYLTDVRHLSKEKSAWYTLAVNLTFSLFAVLGGGLSSIMIRRFGLRLGLRCVPMTAMTIAALLLFLGSGLGSPGATVIAMALGMGFIGASEGSFWTAAVRIGGRQGATAAGFINTGGNVPGLIAPVATPWIAAFVNSLSADAPGKDTSAGWAAALVVTSIVCLAGVFFWLWVDVEKPLD